MLALDLLFLAAAFGARTVLQWRRTGDTGWRLGRPHSPAELAARLLLVIGGALLGVSLRSEPTPGTLGALGVTIAVAAIGLVVVAQLQMGSSWRIGVDLDERTELVRSGLYGSIRNPIYTGMVLFAIGQAIVLPGPSAGAAVLGLIVGVGLQVRCVEEPYLQSLHGEVYLTWAATAGRFAPFVGRLG